MDCNKRNIFTLFLFLVLVLESKSQDTLTKPDKFCFGTNIFYTRAEIGIHDKMTIGAHFRFYNREYSSGIKTGPYFRFYPFERFDKFYIQANASFGQHKITMFYNNDSSFYANPNYTYNNQIKKVFSENALGGGLAIGMMTRHYFLKKFKLDITLCYNFYPFPKNIPMTQTDGYSNFTATEEIEEVFIPIKVGEARWKHFLGGPGTPITILSTLSWVF